MPLVFRDEECFSLGQDRNDLADFLRRRVIGAFGYEKLRNAQRGVGRLEDELRCTIRIDWLAEILGLLGRKDYAKPKFSHFASKRNYRPAVSEGQVVRLIEDNVQEEGPVAE